MEDDCHPSGTIRMKATDFSIAAIIGRDGEHHKPSSPESAKPLPIHNVFTFGKFFSFNGSFLSSLRRRFQVARHWPTRFLSIGYLVLIIGKSCYLVFTVFRADRMPKTTTVGETLLPTKVESPTSADDDVDAEKDVDVEQFSDAGDINAERRGANVSPTPSLMSDDAGVSVKSGDLDELDAEDGGSESGAATSSNAKASKKASVQNSQVKPRCNCDDLMAIDCHLETKELWDKFHDLGTEMIITKTGRYDATPFYFSFHLYLLSSLQDCFPDNIHTQCCTPSSLDDDTSEKNNNNGIL